MYNNGKIRGVDLIGNSIPNVITECFSQEGSHFNIWESTIMRKNYCTVILF